VGGHPFSESEGILLPDDTIRLDKGRDMATNIIHLSDELLAELQARAQAEGKTVDGLAEEALRKGLEKHDWQDLLEYGRERGRTSGHTEEDVPRVVKEWRREQHRS
jgi:hypothetical protein